MRGVRGNQRCSGLLLYGHVHLVGSPRVGWNALGHVRGAVLHVSLLQWDLFLQMILLLKCCLLLCPSLRLLCKLTLHVLRVLSVLRDNPWLPLHPHVLLQPPGRHRDVGRPAGLKSPHPSLHLLLLLHTMVTRQAVDGGSLLQQRILLLLLQLLKLQLARVPIHPWLSPRHPRGRKPQPWLRAPHVGRAPAIRNMACRVQRLHPREPGVLRARVVRVVLMQGAAGGLRTSRSEPRRRVPVHRGSILRLRVRIVLLVRHLRVVELLVVGVPCVGIGVWIVRWSTVGTLLLLLHNHVGKPLVVYLHLLQPLPLCRKLRVRGKFREACAHGRCTCGLLCRATLSGSVIQR